MPNKLLMVWDKGVIGMNGVAKACKAIPSKLLMPLTLFSICCTVVSVLGKDELKNFAILKTAYYDTVVACFPGLVDFLSASVGKAVFCTAMLVIVIAWILRKFYRQHALLITHSTMGHNMADLESCFKKSYWLKRVNVGVKLPSQDTSFEEIVNAIENQDNLFKTINQTNWRKNIFYYGVAHTPLIFRLGHQFGQKCRICLLHRFRPTEDAQEFKELPQNDDDKEAWAINSLSDKDVACNELLVAIATTYPIKDEDLRSIDPENEMLVYKVYVNRKGYDFFSSYRKIRSYADRIAEDIRQIVKEKNIHTIHLVISSSVPFTFYLAQQMNTNQFPDIMVYHYNQVEKYRWGVKVQEPVPAKAAVYARRTSQLKI